MFSMAGLRLRVQMNGGLWRRVEASITLGNNAMTNQRDSGMTIALERIQYWEIQLIDGGPADTRVSKNYCVKSFANLSITTHYSFYKEHHF